EMYSSRKLDKAVELYVSLADAYLQFCDFQSAIMNYRRAYTLNPGNEELQLQVGFTTYIQVSLCLPAIKTEVAGNTQRLALCNSDITAALAMDPTCLGALSLKSRLGERAEEAKAQAVNSALRGQMKEAMQKINKALENNPNEANYYILRGTLYRKLKEFNAAIDDYLFALDKVNYNDQSQIFGEAQGQLLLTYNDFAVYCYQRGFYEEAILLLNQAIRGEKQQKGLYINRGDCFFKKENLEYALLDYEQALDLDNKDHNIKDRIAIVHLPSLDCRKYLDAEKNFTIAIQNSPRAAMYYLHRAKAQRFMEHLQQSQEDVVTALLLDSQHKEVTVQIRYSSYISTTTTTRLHLSSAFHVGRTSQGAGQLGRDPKSEEGREGRERGEGRESRGELKAWLKRKVLGLALKEEREEVRRRHWGMEFQSLGAERLKARPPMVGQLGRGMWSRPEPEERRYRHGTCVWSQLL
uniref:Tetratricopeptide repeat domain 16 n=1 Tax=Callorhinchus milii TaxID=7868 RepID=A0A4W3IXZ6_CALMI